MIGPRTPRRSIGRLFPPSVRRDDVHPSVSVDVTNAESVLRSDTVSLLRDLMHDPRCSRICRIGTGPADRAASHERYIRLAVAIHVFENSNLRRDRGQDVELIPAARLAL